MDELEEETWSDLTTRTRCNDARYGQTDIPFVRALFVRAR
jgi:hypothetical protein